MEEAGRKQKGAKEMKKSLRNSILLLLTAMLLTVSALADSGPKAQLTVKVENAPSEPYYLDLLE